MTFITTEFGAISTDNSNSSLAQTAYNSNSDTVASATTSTVTLGSSASASDDVYNGLVIEILYGTGLCQSRIISDYVGSTKVATLSENWAIIPENTSIYVIHQNSGLAQAGSDMSITLKSGDNANDEFYQGCYISILDGDGKCQLRKILSYDGSSKVVSIEGNWDKKPSSTSKYTIYGESGLASSGTASTIVLNGTQSSIVSSGHFISIYAGTGIGQIREISSISTNTVTVTSNWVVTPDSTSRYTIFGGWNGLYEEVVQFSQINTILDVNEYNGEKLILIADFSFDDTGTLKKSRYIEVSNNLYAFDYKFQIASQYARIVLIGMGTPITGGIQTSYYASISDPPIRYMNEDLSDAISGSITRSVITARTQQGRYKNVSINPEGFLNVAVQQPLSIFNELLVAQYTPVAQLNFVYGAEESELETLTNSNVDIYVISRGTAGSPAIQRITMQNGSVFPTSGAGSYFTLYSAGDTTTYYVWFNVDSGNSDPAPGGTGVQVNISTSDTHLTVATAVKDAIHALSDFNATLPIGNMIQIVNAGVGITTSMSANNMPSGVCSSVSVVDAILNCKSGDSISSGIGSYCVVRSRRSLKYRPGIGATARFASIYSTPIAGTLQYTGIFNAMSGYFIGYAGTTFAIIKRNGGKPEVRTLTITTGASGSENATIILDNQTFVIALTSGSTTHNAYEIANYSYFGTGGWMTEQAGSTIIFTSGRLTETLGPRVGAFSFSSSTAVGTFVRTTTGVVVSTININQNEWNLDRMDGSGNSGMVLDPTKGNIYQIDYQRLGFGDVIFSVQDPTSGRLTPFHKHKTSNQLTSVDINVPHFQIGWVSTTTQTNTPITTCGSSAAMMVQGDIRKFDPKYAITRGKTISTSSTVPVFSLRNLRILNGIPNQAEMVFMHLSVSNELDVPVILEIYYNPTLDETNFESINGVSCGTVDTMATTVGGTVIYNAVVTSGSCKSVEMAELSIILQKTNIITFAVRQLSTPSVSADVNIAVTWFEDK